MGWKIKFFDYMIMIMVIIIVRRHTFHIHQLPVVNNGKRPIYCNDNSVKLHAMFRHRTLNNKVTNLTTAQWVSILLQLYSVIINLISQSKQTNKCKIFKYAAVAGVDRWRWLGRLFPYKYTIILKLALLRAQQHIMVNRRSNTRTVRYVY